jgi:uncharacterized protein (TIGR02300 family)
MSKPEFGVKHTCDACTERFYDLNRTPAVCFKCGAVQAPKPPVFRTQRTPAGRGAFSRRPPPAPMPEAQEPAGDLLEDDAEVPEPSDDDDDEDLDEVLEVAIDAEDEKALT